MTETQPFTISRNFKAPRELVFACHTQVEHLAKWLSPAGFKVIKADLDLRPGGIYHYGLEGPDGMQMWGKQVYREIKAPEKIVLVQSFSDKDGGMTRHPMSPTWPREMLSTTTFEDLGNGETKVTVSFLPLNAGEEEIKTFDGARPSMSGGFKGSFDNLESYLGTLQK